MVIQDTLVYLVVLVCKNMLEPLPEPVQQTFPFMIVPKKHIKSEKNDH